VDPDFSSFSINNYPKDTVSILLLTIPEKAVTTFHSICNIIRAFSLLALPSDNGKKYASNASDMFPRNAQIGVDIWGN
jgi:hypothetical protein